MGRKAQYHQFCPVAVAAEIFAERWTPLVIRELLCGSRRFNDLRRGVPRMSQSLLSRRLKELEAAGLIYREPALAGHGWEYRLTAAGEELRPIVENLGAWGYRWVQTQVKRDDLDAALLMWDMKRNIVTNRLPRGPLVIHFHYPDAAPGYRRYWLLWEDEAVDICLDDPGRPVDLYVRSDLRTMTLIWLGDLSIAKAMAEGRMEVDGPAHLRKAFPGWLGLSLFAGGERERGAIQPPL